MVIVVTGPSCAGKSPLVKSFQNSMKQEGVRFQSPILYHSRRKRPQEIEGQDFYFRSQKEIENLQPSSRFQSFQIRDNVQAVNILTYKDLLEKNHVIYEGHPQIALFLKEIALKQGQSVYDIFISPLSRTEIESFTEIFPFEEFKGQLIDWMARRLKRCYKKQKNKLEPGDHEDIKVRSEAILEDLGRAGEFSRVLVNHDGEDSDHWDVFPLPIGEASQSVTLLKNLILKNNQKGFEVWPEDFLNEIKKK